MDSFLDHHHTHGWLWN